MDLKSIVENKLSSLRLMSFSEINSLPEQSDFEIKNFKEIRQGMSVYIERCDKDSIRVIIKAFESKPGNLTIFGYAEGFRITREGKHEELSKDDRYTLY